MAGRETRTQSLAPGEKDLVKPGRKDIWVGFGGMGGRGTQDTWGHRMASGIVMLHNRRNKILQECWDDICMFPAPWEIPMDSSMGQHTGWENTAVVDPGVTN